MVKIAIVGSTGLVGQTIIKILKEENINAEYIYFNSQNLNASAVKRFKPDFALFAVSADLAHKWVPVFTDMGCKVIDNSSAYRQNPDVPLVIPECNGSLLKNFRGNIIANPNCSTIGSVTAVKPLDDAYGIKRIVYSTYQAVSGAGKNPTFEHAIDNNLIPYIDGEEEKMIFETKKILGKPDIGVSATCVRVPVANCHSISINVEFENDIDIVHVKNILKTAPGVTYTDSLPMPRTADGKNEVFAGRVREDKSRKNTINLFTVSDNIRKGAALNAVQILKCLMSL